MTCELKSCRICTPCYHGHHEKCAGTALCNADNIRRRCECCGTKEKS